MCPEAWPNVGFSYSTDDMNPDAAGAQPLSEGVGEVNLVPYDVLVKSPTSHPRWVIKKDISPPSDRSPAGSLYDRAGEFLTENSYSLRVDGHDQFSGVQSVEYRVHQGGVEGPVVNTGGTTSASNSSCHPQNGCSNDFSNTFNVDTSQLADGRYTVETIVKDQLAADAINGAQHVRRRSFAVEVDRRRPRRPR